jgi:hypothetical protein
VSGASDASTPAVAPTLTARPGQSVKVVTLQGEPALIETLWKRLAPSLWPALDDADDVFAVRFAAAPRACTVVEVVLADVVGGGGLVGSAVARLRGATAPSDVERVLRAFKQIVETGEVLLSDASIYAGPHAAQPDDSVADAATDDTADLKGVTP